MEDLGKLLLPLRITGGEKIVTIFLTLYHMQPIPANYPIYKTLALEIFVECDPKEVLNLRTALYNFYRLLEGTGESRG